MKKTAFFLILILVVIFSSIAFANSTILVADIPFYLQLPETDLYSFDFAAIDGSGHAYHFVQRPDGKLVLEYTSPANPSWHHQYPLAYEAIVRDDGVILLDFEEDYGGIMYPNGVLLFGGQEYWPTWLTAQEQNARSSCGDVLGGIVPAVVIDSGHYRIGNGHYGYDKHFYFVPNGGQPVLLAEDSQSTGFCVYNNWFYLTCGKVDAAGNYVAYQKNSLFNSSEVYLVGINREHLYFCNSIDCMIFETDLDGNNAQCIYAPRLGDVEIVFTSMNESTLCFTYSSNLNTVESENAFVLIDLNTRNFEYIKPQPCITTGDLSHQAYNYANWAGIYGDCVLFYNAMDPSAMVRKLDLNTREITDFLSEYELGLRDGFYTNKPRCARIGDWIYHPYYGDRTELVRSKLDGSVTNDYLATMSEEIHNVTFSNGELILNLDAPMLTNEYVVIGY